MDQHTSMLVLRILIFAVFAVLFARASKVWIKDLKERRREKAELFKYLANRAALCDKMIAERDFYKRETDALNQSLEDTEHDRAEWEKRYNECFQHLREDRAKIAELEKDRDEWKLSAECSASLVLEHQSQISELQKHKIWAHDRLNEAKYERDEAQYNQRTTWHAHQIVKKGKQVVCLTAIVTAEDGAGAVAAFEAQMKEVKAKMRIRSKAPVFAKPVFPNY